MAHNDDILNLLTTKISLDSRSSTEAAVGFVSHSGLSAYKETPWITRCNPGSLNEKKGDGASTTQESRDVCCSSMSFSSLRRVPQIIRS
jgi:hypothetical protein